MQRSRMSRTPLAIAVASVVTGGGLLSVPAIAQDTSIALEEVIVTASRRSVSIQDIPMNITAVSGDMLLQQRLTNLADIARVVPGLAVPDQGSRSTTNNIIIRGLNTTSSGPSLEDPYSANLVATYMGEVPLYLDLQTQDLERVEVLIGPQGTLYGSGSMTGAIRYIPNKPQFDAFSGEVRGELYQVDEGDDLSYGTGVTLNMPITDTFAARVTLDYVDDSGFIDYDYVVRESGVSNPEPDFSDAAAVNANLRSVEDGDARENTTARIALRWQPNERFDAIASYWYQKEESDGRTLSHEASMRDLVNIDEYVSALRFEEPLERETELFSLEIVADLGFAELTSATGVASIDQDSQRDQTDLLLNFEFPYAEFPEFSAFTDDDTDYDNFVQEIRLVSQNDGPFNWIAGVFYNKAETDSSSKEFTPGLDQFLVDNFGGVQLRPDSLEFASFLDAEREETAVYADLEYVLGDWTFNVGGRYYDYEEDLSQGATTPLVATVLGGAPQDSIDFDTQSADGDDSGSLVRFNVSYQFNDDLLGYATYSEGYRVGGINAIIPCTQDIIDSGSQPCALGNEEAYEPDETTNYELGIRSQWLEQRLTLNGAVYYMEWDEVQVASRTVNGGFPITVNGSEAESVGLELSAVALINESLTMSATYAYNNSELTDDVPGLISGDDAQDGDRLPGSPEHAGSFMVDYIAPLFQDYELRLNYSAFYTGDVYTTVGNRGNSFQTDRDGNQQPQGWGEELDSYWLHNVSASTTIAGVDATLFVDNLANENATTAVRLDSSFLRTVGSNDFAIRSYGEYLTRPRSIGLRVSYNF